MNTKEEAYKQKMEIELELVQAKLAELKAQPNGTTTWKRVKNYWFNKILERRVAVYMIKLNKLDETTGKIRRGTMSLKEFGET